MSRLSAERRGGRDTEAPSHSAGTALREVRARQEEDRRQVRRDRAEFDRGVREGAQQRGRAAHEGIGGHFGPLQGLLAVHRRLHRAEPDGLVRREGRLSGRYTHVHQVSQAHATGVHQSGAGDGQIRAQHLSLAPAKVRGGQVGRQNRLRQVPQEPVRPVHAYGQTVQRLEGLQYGRRRHLPRQAHQEHLPEVPGHLHHVSSQ